MYKILKVVNIKITVLLSVILYSLVDQYSYTSALKMEAAHFFKIEVSISTKLQGLKFLDICVILLCYLAVCKETGEEQQKKGLWQITVWGITWSCSTLLVCVLWRVSQT